MKMSKSCVILSCCIILFSISAYSTTGTVPQSESDIARIAMLEKALAPQKVDEVATLFAKANKDRNGAVQFMLFSNPLKNKYKDRWPYWVSGVSSPWITSYTIKKEAQSKNTWKFKITYQWATASGPFQPSLVQTIVVAPVPKNASSSQKYWITQFNEL
ncbi:hypothetical protein [Legionella longbeachae]|uniref:Uncharacterized protein n=1 Tax=Legionella longbeachae serogroup 1 (strain NSW150) TaxID=661367 RepID=D3HM03_LEGLN|nr:hypothetical protein [Legionella longbeachae]VEE03915.1 Uncharacterised protein [Legionella oakridgensis]HBD7397304.1 hypothetical protein [Legionella pneumophila]ARB93229.1 hypothetical protein A6J40_14060 [Legionella longbeachae]ARM33707.1 hypothetical protein B0B39_09280 [Legionella longbeachae]QIN33577.1 hypothetical protein GCB94_16190 [Legionella longbeachae]